MGYIYIYTYNELCTKLSHRMCVCFCGLTCIGFARLLPRVILTPSWLNSGWISESCFFQCTSLIFDLPCFFANLFIDFLEALGRVCDMRHRDGDARFRPWEHSVEGDEVHLSVWLQELITTRLLNKGAKSRLKNAIKGRLGAVAKLGDAQDDGDENEPD